MLRAKYQYVFWRRCMISLAQRGGASLRRLAGITVTRLFTVGLSLVAGAMFAAASAHAGGWNWFFAHRHPTGRCGAAHEWVVAYYSSSTRVACGGKFNPNGLTAAHRSLPCGTRLHVRNPKNGKSIVVTINDRGPFVKGVSLDLARGAARALGMTQTAYLCVW
jgi:rare lipoprotein A